MNHQRAPGFQSAWSTLASRRLSGASILDGLRLVQLTEVIDGPL